MNKPALTPVEKQNFIFFLLFFFFYYFIMSAYFPFFPVWLADVAHLSKTDTGIVFSCISLFAIIFSRCLVSSPTSSGCANTCCGR